MRARVQFNAKINDKTDAVVRMTTDSIEFGNTYDDNTGESTGAAYIDRAYVDHRFGKYVSAKVGRFNQVIGNGYFYDDTFAVLKLTSATIKFNSKGPMAIS